MLRIEANIQNIKNLNMRFKRLGGVFLIII